MAAWLEHKAGSDPVEFAQEMRAFLNHIRAFKTRTTAGHKAHGIATSVAINAEEGVGRHGGLLREVKLESLRTEARQINSRRALRNQISDKTPRCC